MKAMTQKQIFKLTEKHKYIQLRMFDNDTITINTGILKMKRFIMNRKSDQPTPYYSYRSLSFMEYISKKSPFITKPVL